MESYRDSSSLECYREANVCVFVVKTHELLDDLAEPLRREFALALRESPPAGVVLSLERVGYASSAGIGALLTLQRRVKEAGREMVLCGLSAQVTLVLRLCQLIGQPGSTAPAVFATEPDVAAAVLRLCGPPPAST